MKQINWADAKNGTNVLVFDTKNGTFGTVTGYGCSGNYDIYYVNFKDITRKIKPILDATKQRYLCYSSNGKNPEIERIVTNLSEVIEFRDCFVSDRRIRSLVKRNYDKLKTRTFAQFIDFANDLEGSDCDWRETCEVYDLK